MKHENRNNSSRFLAVGFFAVLVVAGLSYGIWSAYRSAGSRANQTIEVSAPTVEEYRSEASVVVAPFLEQMSALPDGELSDQTNDSLLSLAATTQERLLRMTVPGSERDAHLSFVTLIDRWRRIADGQDGDRESIRQQATDLLIRYDWLKGETEPQTP
ncbi:MAG: hypothetical protein ABIJ46_00025 [bacterium]